MWKPTAPLSSLHLRKLLHLRCFSALPNSLTHQLLTFPPPPPSPPFHTFATGRFQYFSIRDFSNQPDNSAANSLNEKNPEKLGAEEKSISKLFSNELQKNPDSDPFPLPKRLDLSSSHVSPAVLLPTLNISPDAGDFLIWDKSRPGFKVNDDVLGSVELLKGLGFSEATITAVIETLPALIISVEGDVRDRVEFLMRIGLSRSEWDRVIRLFPRILSIGIETRLKPLLDEFSDLGFSLSNVRREVVREPRVLGLENGELSDCLKLVRSLKCRAAIKQSIYRDGEFRAGLRVKLRVDCLREHGLTYRDAFTVLWKEPRAILYDAEDIKKKIEFLVNKMRFNIECLVEVPEYLGVNLDKQIAPRFDVIEHLRSRGGLGDEVSLRKLVKLSRLRFYNMYVKPYPECEEIYGRFARKSLVRSRHPVGMWKLFRPQKYPESEEDVKNIKYLMESFPK